ncbi:ATP synthase subunit alpha [Seminavis robusta]|uniref:ATP synthase subunit alpha n=1 Tax=Seminavis robusta TaxID=568900 RepID=A0A9N8E1V6_9STRA|nr:ATP synthase subunit alpha [Seminavis robusta]|eukprot:Sro536_g162070.1 ATP synthase subunit alpha (680) ;mRNA; f:5718-7899
MRFESYAVAAVAVLGQCFFVPSQAWTTSGPNVNVRTVSSSSAILNKAPWSLGASVVAEGQVDSSLEESSLGDPEQTPLRDGQKGKTLLANGSVVSFFRGGLAAVRIEEENVQATEMSAVGKIPDALKKSMTADAGGDLTGHLAQFPDGKSGVVVAHRPPIAFVYSDMDTLEAPDGKVSVFQELATRPIWNETLVTGWNGNPIRNDDNDKQTPDGSSIRRNGAIFAPIPQVKDIDLINNPMLTGNTMVDVLAPIGQGQNMLLVADDLSFARGMMVDFIGTQKANQIGSINKGVQFVYAAIDDSQDVLQRLQSANLLNDVHVVATNPKQGSDVEEPARAAEATAIAASACSIAESYALEEGQNAVVIIDTLDQHKKMWDATTRTLVDIFGIESVVKSDREGGASSEMRGFFSSIIQRAGQYKKKRGGGSVTLVLLCELPKVQADEDAVFAKEDFEGSSEKVRARLSMLVDKSIPLTAANLRKIDIPVPSAQEGKRRLVLQHIDDLISMTDGQIWLDEALRKAGQYPPIDPQRSITRVGIGADTKSRADAPAFRRIAEGLRLTLSQAANMEGAEDTNASKKQVRSQNALLLAMHQVEGRGGRTLAQSCVALLAASKGLLDDAVGSGNLAGTDAGQQLMDNMINHVQQTAPTAMARVCQDLDLEESIQKELLEALESFFEEES